MSTLKIWDLHMKYDGPITDEFLAKTKELAESIAKEPGVIWKIWTIEEGQHIMGLHIYSKTMIILRLTKPCIPIDLKLLVLR